MPACDARTDLQVAGSFDPNACRKEGAICNVFEFSRRWNDHNSNLTETTKWHGRYEISEQRSAHCHSTPLGNVLDQASANNLTTTAYCNGSPLPENRMPEWTLTLGSGMKCESQPI